MTAALMRQPGGVEAAVRIARWLSFAAAPTFAAMALVTSIAGAPDPLCAPTQGVSALGGMVPMYLLMSAFHAAPWLRLIGRQA